MRFELHKYLRSNLIIFAILFACAGFGCQPAYDQLYWDGQDLFKQGDYQGALNSFNEYLKYEPKNADTIYYRGLTYYKLGEYEKAVSDFELLLTWYPNYPEYLDKLEQAKEALESKNNADSDRETPAVQEGDILENN